ncbi:hypothetical protein [Aeoliella mucimassa]|nr:hypothetical protein [Aeoliella mucimassa]
MSDVVKIKTCCPHCGSVFKVAARHVGKVAKCPAARCGNQFRVVEMDAAPARTLDTPFNRSYDGHFAEDDADRLKLPEGQDESHGFTLSNTMASHPGNIKVNYLRWVLHQPKWPCLFTLGEVACLGLLAWASWWWWILLLPIALLMTLVNVFYWWRLSNHFQFGCANVGQVVSLEPTLLAVDTDLSHGEGDYPVIKIIEISIDRSGGKPLEIGMHVPTVSLYAPPPEPDAPHWANFFPLPADYVCGKPEQIEQLLARLDRDDYENLDKWLKSVPQPYKPGLYLMWSEPDKAIGRLPEWKIYD